MSETIDVAFDFRTDTPPGRDPDALSKTLRRYHKILWGRKLPDGSPFSLDDSGPIGSRYLAHRSELREFLFSSDSVIPTFTRWKRMQHIITQVPEKENKAFRSLGYTIGGMMIWPKYSIKGLRTINVERGFNPQISDRMDLTLECIRRHYTGESSPMSRVLEANNEFFALFGSFNGFVGHFLIQDLLAEGSSKVAFFMPFDDFTTPAVPKDVQTYKQYRSQTIAFIHARNRRIKAFINQPR